MKQIFGYPEYEINEDGTIIRRVSAMYGKINKTQIKLSPQILNGKPTGYIYAMLLSKTINDNGNEYLKPGIFRVAVHRLVALTYIGPAPDGKPWVNHEDGNKSNNHWTNLRWSSISENIKHSFDKLGRKPSGGMSGKKHSLETKNRQSKAKKGKNHPKYSGCYYIRGRKYYSALEASHDLGIAAMTILRKCKKGATPDYKFVPDKEKIL